MIDWLLSNHDSTGSNYVSYQDRIVPIDKEHCFRFILPNARYASTYPEGDALDLTFPIKGLTPVYAHKFWGLFAQGKLDFDPRVLLPIIEAIDAVSEARYLELLAPFLSSDFFVTEQADQQQTFLARAIAHKRSVRTDYERFLAMIHRARAKPAAAPGAGRFTFADGWDASAPDPP